MIGGVDLKAVPSLPDSSSANDALVSSMFAADTFKKGMNNLYGHGTYSTGPYPSG